MKQHTRYGHTLILVNVRFVAPLVWTWLIDSAAVMAAQEQVLPSYQDSKPGEGPAVVQTTGPPLQVVQLNQPVPQPKFTDCPVTVVDSEGKQFQTVLEYRVGLLTWLAFSVICLATVAVGFCFLAFIPFCIKSLKDVYHINPNNGRIVGVYKRIY